ncbi:MAG: prepilin-type N-terminal cleavage/methylation domain-containing protein [Planctomycetaceae bacterium]|nr:prepilin-type N-terminal cleavage/methylation domain-containing protein [Planctomycetaceae bacterium]
MISTFTFDDVHQRDKRNVAITGGAFGRGSSKAFTLLEVLLVIAIMVAVLAVALPVMRGSFDVQRLRKAGETIQTEWAKARNQAIKTGKVHVFQHALYSDQYVTTLQTSLENMLAELSDETNETGGSFSQNDSPFNSSSNYKQLPEGIFFMGADVRMDSRTTYEMTSFEAAPVVQDYSATSDAQEVTGEIRWGMPIFFFPDGTTSGATLALADDDQKSLTVSLRALTGISRVGTVQSLGDFSERRATP